MRGASGPVCAHRKPSFLSTQFFIALVLTFFLTASLTLSAASLREEQTALRNLQKRINTLQKQIRKDSRTRDKNLAGMENIDKQIASKRSKLRDLAISIANAELDIAKVEKKKQAALSDLTVEQKQLAALIQLAHRQQGTSTLKWLLDMENPAELARTMTYYRYLMQDQKINMQVVSKQVMGFVDILTVAQQAKEKTLQLKAENDAALAELNNDRQARNALVTQLNENIQNQQTQITQLESEENALLRVISELQAALADFPKDPQQSFRSLKGKLAWPLSGKIQNVYGNYRIPKQGLKWRGLQIKAERNSEIRAIAYGRVVYADWLPGMGLLSIIDHGDGYLSLYGNCEMLFQKVGTWVKAGDVIALVGDSGGRNEVGLYLELRKGKRPFSPQSWFRSRRP